MQQAFAADLWQLFGVSFLEQDQLTWADFEWMTMSADRARED